MLIKLEEELLKLNDIKRSIKEMGASLWQGKIRKGNSRIRDENARKRILGWYKKSRRSD